MNKTVLPMTRVPAFRLQRFDHHVIDDASLMILVGIAFSYYFHVQTHSAAYAIANSQLQKT